MVETRRAGLGLALAAALLAAAPGLASAAMPVALYPLRGEGLTLDQLTEVQSLVEAALRLAGRRDFLEPRTPLVLPKLCGAVPADVCLAGLSKGGAVLVARAKQLPDTILVVLSLVDAKGRRTRAVGLGVTLDIQDPRPLDRAIAALEFELGRAAEAPPAVASAAPKATPTATPTQTPTPTPTATASAASAPTVSAAPTPTPAPTAPPPDLSPPRPAIVAEAPFRVAPPDPERAWLRATGQAWTVGGGVLLAGGAVVGFLGKRLGDDLDRRYLQGELSAADHGSFGRARGLGIAANILFAAGGVAGAAGLTMWALAPDVQPVAGGATVGVAGRF